MDIFLAMILSFLKRLSHLMPQCYEFLLLFSSLPSPLFYSRFLIIRKPGQGRREKKGENGGAEGGGGKEGGETSLEATEAALNGNVGGTLALAPKRLRDRRRRRVHENYKKMTSQG